MICTKPGAHVAKFLDISMRSWRFLGHWTDLFPSADCILSATTSSMSVMRVVGLAVGCPILPWQILTSWSWKSVTNWRVSGQTRNEGHCSPCGCHSAGSCGCSRRTSMLGFTRFARRINHKFFSHSAASWSAVSCRPAVRPFSPNLSEPNLLLSGFGPPSWCPRWRQIDTDRHGGPPVQATILPESTRSSSQPLTCGSITLQPSKTSRLITATSCDSISTYLFLSGPEHMLTITALDRSTRRRNLRLKGSCSAHQFL